MYVCQYIRFLKKKAAVHFYAQSKNVDFHFLSRSAGSLRNDWVPKPWIICILQRTTVSPLLCANEKMLGLGEQEQRYPWVETKQAMEVILIKSEPAWKGRGWLTMFWMTPVCSVHLSTSDFRTAIIKQVCWSIPGPRARWLACSRGRKTKQSR